MKLIISIDSVLSAALKTLLLTISTTTTILLLLDTYLESQRVTDSFNHWRGQTVNTVFRLPGGFTSTVGELDRGAEMIKMVVVDLPCLIRATGLKLV
ncbi:hypothetical protein BIT28_10515 [Photobacterium proteolyticum]|uniref:Uncharacterized protein n=1 Tax=Photobacterium proteolyticum TaxID=1903952 RepID=A0A1Q9G6W4_9GAMM|nr:hypothetical protein BIT28_10515 [Photobacterium proteolyticum]